MMKLDLQLNLTITIINEYKEVDYFLYFSPIAENK